MVISTVSKYSGDNILEDIIAVYYLRFVVEKIHPLIVGTIYIIQQSNIIYLFDIRGSSLLIFVVNIILIYLSYNSPSIIESTTLQYYMLFWKLCWYYVVNNYHWYLHIYLYPILLFPFFLGDKTLFIIDIFVISYFFRNILLVMMVFTFFLWDKKCEYNVVEILTP